MPIFFSLVLGYLSLLAGMHNARASNMQKNMQAVLSKIIICISSTQLTNEAFHPTLLLLVIFLLCSLFAFAQNKTVDSLYKDLETQKEEKQHDPDTGNQNFINLSHNYIIKPLVKELTLKCGPQILHS